MNTYHTLFPLLSAKLNNDTKLQKGGITMHMSTKIQTLHGESSQSCCHYQLNSKSDALHILKINQSWAWWNNSQPHNVFLYHIPNRPEILLTSTKPLFRSVPLTRYAQWGRIPLTICKFNLVFCFSLFHFYVFTSWAFKVIHHNGVNTIKQQNITKFEK